MPLDMRDAKIITIYKNKGARLDCNNRRGIYLLGIAGKVILPRLKKLTARVYSDSQCEFRY